MRYTATITAPDGRRTTATFDAPDVASAQLQAVLRSLIARCARCDGTILAPARCGAPRGTCHCPTNRRQGDTP